ncbi:unnamed protein product [Brassicogethes aeneus]|uniref:DUF4371 domain-containing protein n=1 Tax=Brassicogethes aeneus TaxID=1431903 RepID=A0A9P0B1S9_BRAAE|nr:unnamed protein product [Brassicogethes aeneus]
MVELLAHYDDVMKQVISMPSEKIISNISSAPFFSLMLDTTQDIAKKDQLSIIIRTVHIIRDLNNIATSFEIKENFLRFYELKDQSAQGMSEKILSILKDLNIPLSNCYGQGYDGANIFVILWISSNIQGISSEPLNQLNKVLPSFSGINIYHQVRDRKPKPFHRSPKPRIPHHNLPKGSLFEPHIPSCKHQIDNHEMPHNFGEFLSPPPHEHKPSFKHQGKVSEEIYDLILKRPDFFEDYETSSEKSISFETKEHEDVLNPVHIPSFNNPKLSKDFNKNSYNTPGARDSYGNPIKKNTFISGFNNYDKNFSFNEDENYNLEPYLNVYDILKSKQPAAFSKNAIQYSVDKKTGEKVEDYFAVNFNVDFIEESKQHDHQDHNKQNAEHLLNSKNSFEEIRYPNHRYEV